MAVFATGENGGIHYRHDVAGEGKPTFAFFNALTGETAMWDATIAPALRAAGYGTLLFNYRGQRDSPIGERAALDADQVSRDCAGLLAHLAIGRLLAVGLSIGGYFAIRAQLAGAAIAGHVMLNTLRVDGPRLAWVNDATLRIARLGGGRLLRDVYGPLLFNEEYQAANRDQFLSEDAYEPMPADHPDALLLAIGATANWDIPWEAIDVPVEVVTGRQDRVFRDPEAIEAILARLPDAASNELADCGHMVPAERPQAVIDACLRLAGRVVSGMGRGNA